MGIHFQYQLKLLYIILYISIIIIIREINFDSKGLYVLFEITDTLNIPTILSFLQIFGIFLHKKKKKKKIYLKFVKHLITHQIYLLIVLNIHLII